VQNIKIINIVKQICLFSESESVINVFLKFKTVFNQSVFNLHFFPNWFDK